MARAHLAGEVIRADDLGPGPVPARGPGSRPYTYQLVTSPRRPARAAAALAVAFTELLERAGGVGLFQTLQVITLLLPSVCLPCQMLLDNFSAAIPGHRCWAHMLDNGSGALTNLTAQALPVISIPLGPDHEPHQCRCFHQPQWHLEPNATATNWSERREGRTET